jgi:hypothetical protein
MRRETNLRLPTHRQGSEGRLPLLPNTLQRPHTHDPSVPVLVDIIKASPSNLLPRLPSTVVGLPSTHPQHV